MKQSTLTKISIAFDRAAYCTGVFVLAFIASTAVTLSALHAGYVLADVVYAATAPPDWTPTWDYSTNTARWELTKNVDNSVPPVQEVIDCCIPPDVLENIDSSVPPDVQLNEVNTVPAIYVTAKPSP